MSRINLSERLTKGTLLLDGAVGTQLMAAGAAPGACYEYLNISSPDIVQGIHHAYLDAGCDAVLTNSFGANSISLRRHGHAAEAGRINLAAAHTARKAAGEDRYVLGDIGPCGDFLEPVGTVKKAALKEAFAEQAAWLAKGDVDGFIIQTITALEEAVIALEAVKSVSALVVFVSLSYDRTRTGQFRTMMGVEPSAAVEQLSRLGADAVGFNCGSMEMVHYVELARLHRKLLGRGGVYLLAEPNAGRPQLADDKVVYNISPGDFAAAADNIITAGVSIIGGCCGTAPSHIRALRQLIDQRGK